MSEQVQQPTQNEQEKKKIGIWATIKSVFAVIFKTAKIADTAVSQIHVAQHQLIKEQMTASKLTKEDIKKNNEFLDSLWD